ncbi:hypothetical protein VMCG_03438 [Cytospora schulzeri]|uniref:DUF7708 domain-containing protein n=1 Tax=Cytospora schulzeri TaxID=448051 RepID=A0A423WW94_9PEZI|nr:hypothetical protein VMCG_03438 [Valsa malicola]
MTEKDNLQPNLANFPEYLEKFNTHIDLEDLELIRLANRAPLRLYLDNIVREAKDSETRCKERRKSSRTLKAAERFSKLADQASNFLNVYSGIGEIVKGANSDFGGVAYGLTVLLVTLGKNKQLYEDLATRAIETAEKWLLRVQRLVKAHDGSGEDERQELAHLVDKVYDQTERILYFVINYYNCSSCKRMWRVLGKPPQVHLQPLMDNFQDTVADLMVEHEVLQAEDSRRLRQELAEMSFRHSSQRHCDQVQMLTDWLGFGEPEGGDLQRMISQSRKTHLTSPKTIKFGRMKNSRIIKVEQASLALLGSLPVYKDWWRSETSGLLLLSGEDYKSYGVKLSCWLSPLALEFYESLQMTPNEKERRIFVSNSFLDDRATHAVPTEALFLKCILYQLLRLDNTLCETINDNRTIRNSFKEAGVCDDADPELLIDTAYDALQMAIRELPQDTMAYIIVEDIVLQGQQDSCTALRFLARLVCDPETKATIKALGIARSNLWSILEDKCTSSEDQALTLVEKWALGKRNKGRMYLKLAWKQQKAKI